MAEVAYDCGHEEDPAEIPMITAAGGWCAPSETVYDMTPKTTMCSDCRARMAFIAEIGIDPGRHGENLKVPRGGIKYGKDAVMVEASERNRTGRCVVCRCEVFEPGGYSDGFRMCACHHTQWAHGVEARSDGVQANDA